MTRRRKTAGEADLPVTPEITRTLRAKGTHTLGHETTLARAPMWAARARDKPVQLALLSGPLVMHGVEFRQVEGAQLTVADQRLVAELTTRFLLAGCPADKVVPITLTDAARSLGYDGGDGGKGRRAAKSSLARIRSVTFSSHLNAAEGFPRIWGLIDNADPMSPKGGRPWHAADAGEVTLNKHMAQLLRDGNVTFLHYPTWDAIARADAIAGRLWCYLEAERIAAGWNYSLFACSVGGVDDERYMPAIADMLLLDWPVRRQVAARVRCACDVIAAVDPRYSLQVLKSKAPGMWHLTVHRGRHITRPPHGPLPLAVLRGWQRAYGPRRPSPKQVVTLTELARRRGSEWVRDQLEAARTEDDPLGTTLRLDRTLCSQAMATEVEREKDWAVEKAQESAGGERSLAAIVAKLAAQGMADSRTR